MSLISEFEKTGSVLFKYRSYIPLFLYFIVVPVIWIETNEWFNFESTIWSVFCLSISLLGQLIRALTIGFTPQNTSGRNTKAGQVAEELNTTGMYSIVRHPLYLGNFLMWLGIILYVGSTEFLIFSVFFFWLYYERIMFAEEMFLNKKFGEAFAMWSQNVPAFFPKKLKWDQTPLNFSLKNIIKREYHGIFAMVISFCIVNFLKHLFLNDHVYVNIFWIILLAFAGFKYLLIRFISKKTNLLNIRGR